MKTKISLLLALTLLLSALLAACGGQKAETPAASPPTTAPTNPPPTETPTPAVQLGSVYRSEEGGFSFAQVPGWNTEEFLGFAFHAPPGADTGEGPIIYIISTLYEADTTLEAAYAEFINDFTSDSTGEISLGTPFDTQVKGNAAKGVEITGTSDAGNAMGGRILVILVSPRQSIVAFGGAVQERWNTEISPYHTAVVDSLEFFEPAASVSVPGPGTGPGTEPGTISLPPLTLPSGWYIYSNANVGRDLVVHNGMAYVATLGGVAAWNLSDGTYTKYTPLDGLKHISTYAVTVCDVPQTRIIVGTERGLSLLDPTTGTWDNTYLIPEGDLANEAKIDRLVCDAANRRLLIGYTGLGILNLDTGEYSRVTTSEGLSWSGISDIAVSGQDIWVASGYNGISQIRSSGVTVYNEAGGMPSERALSLAFAPDGTLWIGTSKGLVKYKNNAWTLYDSNAGLFGEISEIEIASDGTVWIGSAPLGTSRVCQFDPATEACRVLFDGMGGSPVTGLGLDDQGRAVFNTFHSVYVYDGETATPLVIQGDLLVTNFVDAFATDAAGMLWVGTDGGLHRLDPANPDGAWETYRSEFFSNDPNSPGGNWAREIAVAPNGDVLVAITNGTASYFSGGQWTSFADFYSYETAAIDSQGRLWLGDDGKGVSVLDTAGTVLMTLTDADGLPSANVRSLLADGDAMWIGTADGLAKYENGALTTLFGKDDPALPDDNVTVLIKEPSGSLLIGTINGVARYDGASTTILVNFYRDFNVFASLTSMALAPDGTIWAGTTDGLYSTSASGWSALTIADGLPTNGITAVYVDAYGTIWVGGGYSLGGGGMLRIIP